jgi:hypothetical protein
MVEERQRHDGLSLCHAHRAGVCVSSRSVEILPQDLADNNQGAYPLFSLWGQRMLPAREEWG